MRIHLTSVNMDVKATTGRVYTSSSHALTPSTFSRDVFYIDVFAVRHPYTMYTYFQSSPTFTSIHTYRPHTISDCFRRHIFFFFQYFSLPSNFRYTIRSSASTPTNTANRITRTGKTLRFAGIFSSYITQRTVLSVSSKRI